jgi:hypothetical protein
LSPLDLIDLSDHTPLFSNSELNSTLNYSDRSIIPTSSPSSPVQQIRYPSLTVRRRTRTTTFRTTINDYRPASFWPAPPDRVTLLDAVKYPAILSHLLDFLAWHDFLAFGYTCRESMKLLKLPELKDVILSHFVPSYRHALRERNLSRYKDVHVAYNDITLFCESSTGQVTPGESLTFFNQCSPSSFPSHSMPSMPTLSSYHPIQSKTDTDFTASWSAVLPPTLASSSSFSPLSTAPRRP